jgi:hypothetical protein
LKFARRWPLELDNRKAEAAVQRRTDWRAPAWDKGNTTNESELMLTYRKEGDRNPLGAGRKKCASVKKRGWCIKIK